MININNNEDQQILTEDPSFIDQGRLQEEFEIPNSEIYEIPKYLIEKVDVIYLSIKNNSNYYTILKFLLFSLAIISYSWIWSFLFMFSLNRQHTYCFNPNIHQFELCSKEQLCANYLSTISVIIYDDNNLSNINDFEDELLKVNRKYKAFFTENISRIFSRLKSSIDYTMRTELNNKFNAAVILSDREHINFHMKYCDLCNYRTSLIIFGAFVIASNLLGNFFMSILSDIFGRKKILVIGIFFTAIFSLCFFSLSTVIDFQISSLKEKFITDQRHNFQEKHVDILQQIYFSVESQRVLRDNKIIFAILLFLIHFFNAGIKHSSLCLLVENSLNDRLVYKNFWFYNNGTIISIFYSYLLSFPSDDFKILYLISGLILLILLYITLRYLYESPRLNFEYSEWKEYTDFFTRTNQKDCEILKQFYITETILQNVKNLEKRLLTERMEEIKESIIRSSKRGSVLDLIEENLNKFRKILKRDEEVMITREEVKRNPFLILAFLIYEKKLRKNKSILLAFIMIVFFINSMISLSFLSKFFYTREGLFAIYIVNSSFFHISLVFLFSNFFFYLIVPFFGFKRVIIFSFVSLFIFGLIIDLPMTDLPISVGDLNRYNYNLIDNYMNERHGRLLRGIIFLIGFFFYGIYYNTYIYLFRFTKTIYRSTFFGFVDSILKIVLFGSVAVSYTFMWNYLIVTIVCIIGIFTVIFLEDKEDNNIITDRKRYGPNFYDYKQ